MEEVVLLTAKSETRTLQPDAFEECSSLQRTAEPNGAMLLTYRLVGRRNLLDSGCHRNDAVSPRNRMLEQRHRPHYVKGSTACVAGDRKMGCLGAADGSKGCLCEEPATKQSHPHRDCFASLATTTCEWKCDRILAPQIVGVPNLRQKHRP